jgi:excisionase family DNA binding protein
MSISDQTIRDALRADLEGLANDIGATTDMDQVKARLYAAMRERPPLPPPAPEQPSVAVGERAKVKGSSGERPLSEVRFLTVAEVASVMRVSKMTVYRLVHAGELPAVRVGRSFRVPEQAVHDYLREAFVDHEVI